jgi:hypothetical protein
MSETKLQSDEAIKQQLFAAVDVFNNAVSAGAARGIAVEIVVQEDVKDGIKRPRIVILQVYKKLDMPLIARL